MKTPGWLVIIILSMVLDAAGQVVRPGAGPIWRRHTIDASAQGADGVKLGDLNRDGRPDLVTGWEEGGVVRVYLNPGKERMKGAWETMTVGKVMDAEEAIFTDLDGDGKLEVVSGTEGTTRQVFWHRRVDGQWRTDPFPATAGKQMWMQIVELDLDGQHGRDLLLGSKGKGAAIGWLRAPEKAEELAAWGYFELRKAGWIMSLETADMDEDGDLDVVFTDRKGERCGLFWLENPGPDRVRAGEVWIEHEIGALGREVVFADVGHFDDDPWLDVAVAVKPTAIHLFRGRADGGWRPQVLQLLDQAIGKAKAVNMADLNGDGLTDLVFTCEDAKGEREGVIWLETQGGDQWLQHSLGGADGVKFDLIQVLDLDGDGDLDVITCEERDQLGVIWYENPTVK